MTYLLLQTFLLLLSAYFLGALIACLMKRAMRTMDLGVPVTAGTTAAATAAVLPKPAAPRPAPVPVTPRPVDLVQPKIEVLARPEPKAAPVSPDMSRFERALMGALTESKDEPRKPIVEIRPAILKSPTGPAIKPAPVPQPAPAPKPVAAAPAPAPQPPAPQPAQLTLPQAAASAAAAAAAAVAAAKAAAAAAAPQPASKPTPPLQPAPPQPVQTQTVQPQTVASQTVQSVPQVAPAPAVKPAAPAPAPISSGNLEGDDFQRIRAIDETTERRLKGLGVKRFEEMAHWTPADVNRVNQALGLSDRIEREQWIEQAQILAKGGETYYSRNRGATPRAAPAPATGLGAGAPPRGPEPLSAAASYNASAAAAAAAAAATLRPQPAPQAAPQPVPQATPQATPQAAPKASLAPAPMPVSEPQSVPQSVRPVLPNPHGSGSQGRSVSEMANAAAAAIAAASASVTRGLRPIEPISPLSKADPNISRPARLQDALKGQEVRAPAPASPAPASSTTAQGPAQATKPEFTHVRSVRSDAARTTGHDDLKRIRGIGVLIEKRLNSLGVHTYDQVADWTSADIDRISQTLDFKGRIEREAWIEQARILSSGGQTEFSRRVDRGDVDSSRDS